MNWIILLFALQLICVLYYYQCFFKEDNVKTFIIKMFSALFFILIGGLCLYYHSKVDHHVILIFIGLLMCLLGDVIIGLRRFRPSYKNLFVLIGMCFFLISHVCYSLAQIFFIKDKIILIIIIILIICVGVLLLCKYTKVDFGKMRIPCYVYSFFSSTMLTLSSVNLFTNFKTSNLILFIGILLFVISDVFLCYTYYKKEMEKVKVIKLISIITYFFGQSLIALSIYFL